MKPDRARLSPALRVSLAANFVLVIAVAVLLRRESVSSSAIRSAARTLPPPRETQNQSAPVYAIRPGPGSAGREFTPAAVAQLEYLGISRDAIADIVIADADQRSSLRLAALQKKYAPRPVPDREQIEFARQCDDEKIRALQAALGEDGYRAWDKEQTLADLNGARPPGDNLPMTADEAEQAYRLQKDFNQKSRELQLAMEDGVADRADVTALEAQAQAALDRALKQLLGEQRFAELRGNVDPTTEAQRKFGDLNPTADQAKAAAQAEQSYDGRTAALAKRLGENSADATNVITELQAIDAARAQELRQIFGAEAYDRAQRQNDPTFKTLTQFADAWQLNDTEIQSVYDTLHRFDEQAELLRRAAEMRAAAGQSVNWREIHSALAQTRQEVEANVSQLIGGERLRRLEQNGLLPAQ